MVEQRHDALESVKNKALYALEHPLIPPQFARPCDFYLTIQPHFARWWDAWHVWFDAEQQTAAALRVFWHRGFDTQRFLDPMMGLKHGWKEVPTLEMSCHVLPYKSFQRHFDAILGIVPANILDDVRGIGGDPPQIDLVLRLPWANFL